MIKVWHERAWEEYIYWQRQDKKTLKKSIASSRILKETVTNA
jgi:toxin YoeB